MGRDVRGQPGASGVPASRPTNVGPDWREGAIDEALKAEAWAGDGAYSLLRRIRRHAPDLAPLTIDGLEPSRYRSFLRERTERRRGLLPAEHEKYDYDDRLVPAFSWHAVSWEGHDLELVVPPGTSGSTVIAVGGSSEAPRAFDRALKDFCDRPEGRALVYASGQWASDAGLDAEVGGPSGKRWCSPKDSPGRSGRRRRGSSRAGRLTSL